MVEAKVKSTDYGILFPLEGIILFMKIKMLGYILIHFLILV